jgi:hypothetical protein
MCVVDLEVPAEDVPDFGEDERVVDHVQKAFVSTDEIDDAETIVIGKTSLGPLSRRDFVGRFEQIVNPVLWKDILEDEEPVLFELDAFRVCEQMLSARGVHSFFLLRDHGLFANVLGDPAF